MKTITKLWILIGILIILTPVGLILPRYFKAGTAWGEWKIFPSVWNAPIPDYTGSPFGYALSAALGIAVVALIVLLVGKFLKKKDNKFIERSIASTADFFKEILFSEEIARSKGLMQSLGAKTRIAVLAVLLVSVILAQDLKLLAALYLFSLLLAAFSHIDIIYFIKRVWFFIPLFTLLIAIPAIFTQSPLTAAVFVLRVVDCVSFVVLITITTRHNELLRSLLSLGIPPIFVSVLDMMYRYVFLFIKIFEEMHLGLKSRLVRRFDAQNARRWISSRMAFLFKRSLKMSEDVYMAMVARGYGLKGGK